MLVSPTGSSMGFRSMAALNSLMWSLILLLSASAAVLWIRTLKCGSGSGSCRKSWCGSGSGSYLVPLDRAQNSDHFTFLTFENPSIRSGARAFQSLSLFWQKKNFGKKIGFFWHIFLTNFCQKIFFWTNICNFWTAERIFNFQKAKWLKISPEIH